MHFTGMCAIHRHACAQFTGGLSEAVGMGGQYFAHTACTVMDIPTPCKRKRVYRTGRGDSPQLSLEVQERNSIYDASNNQQTACANKLHKSCR